MVNSEHKLTVDDLIVEYLMYKTKNGYNPNFSTQEFIDFLHFFETKMEVKDTLYDGEKLFKRFFDRKIEHDWSITYCRPNEKPHMNIEYNDDINDYIISANYKFSDYDKSVINTYFMNPKTTESIRKLIGTYLLRNQEKRKINETVVPNENEITIGKYITAEMIMPIWDSYIKYYCKINMWPEQCRDIEKFLLKTDLAKIIGVPSMKNKFIDFYTIFSKRLAILYNEDKDLKVISTSNTYLARANYDLLIKGYEKIVSIAFDEYKKEIELNLSSTGFKQDHKAGYIHDFENTKSIPIIVGNDKAKRLIKTIDKEYKA